MPWGHATISRTAAAENDEAFFEGTLSGLGYDLSFDGQASVDEVTRRFFAHFMVFVMPPEGLDETVSSLWDVIDFHSGRVPAIASSSELEHITATGRVVDVRDRGQLTVAD